MKKLVISLSLACAALAFVVGSTAIAQTNPAPTVPEHHGEHHPAIRAAIRALERAREEMKAADHDFGGHRVEALAACDRAIEQLNLALQYDRK